MDTTGDEQRGFDHVTCLISASVVEVSGQGTLAADVIEQVYVLFSCLIIIDIQYFVIQFLVLFIIIFLCAFLSFTRLSLKFRD